MKQSPTSSRWTTAPFSSGGQSSTKNLHQRSSSNSFRIQVAAPTPSTSASHSPSPNRGRKHSNSKIILDKLSIRPHFDLSKERSSFSRGSWKMIGSGHKKWWKLLMWLLVAGLVVKGLMLLNPDLAETVASWRGLEKREEYSSGLVRVVQLPFSDSRNICDERKGGGGCSFLFPARIGEAELKSQIHLHQLSLLASSLSRTLILPNLRSSRFSACHPHPFDLYFAPSSLPNSILQSTFERWSQSRPYPLSAQIVRLDRSTSLSSVSLEPFPHALEESESSISMACTKKAKLSFSSHTPLSFSSPPGSTSPEKSLEPFTLPLLDSLLSGAGSNSSTPSIPDVLVIDYDLRSTFLTTDFVDKLLPQSHGSTSLSEFSEFEVRKEWVELASGILEKWGPIVVINWKLPEGSEEEVVKNCADGLHKRLEELKGLKGIWWILSPSLSAVLLSPNHLNKSPSPLLPIFQPFRSLSLRPLTLSLAESSIRLSPFLRDLQKRSPTGYLEGFDGGIKGLVDREVARRAQVFLTVTGACGKESGWEERVVAERERKRRLEREEGEDSGLWNVVGRFGDREEEVEVEVDEKEELSVVES